MLLVGFRSRLSRVAVLIVFITECAPANVRGALVMMWQMWTGKYFLPLTSEDKS